MNVPIHIRPRRVLAAILSSAVAFVFGGALLPAASHAATVTVFAAASLKEALDEQTRRFETDTGNKVSVAYGGSNAQALGERKTAVDRSAADSEASRALLARMTADKPRQQHPRKMAESRNLAARWNTAEAAVCRRFQTDYRWCSEQQALRFPSSNSSCSST